MAPPAPEPEGGQPRGRCPSSGPCLVRERVRARGAHRTADSLGPAATLTSDASPIAVELPIPVRERRGTMDDPGNGGESV